MNFTGYEILDTLINVGVLIFSITYSIFFIINNYSEKQKCMWFYILIPTIFITLSIGLLSLIIFSFSSIYGSWTFVKYVEFGLSIILLTSIIGIISIKDKILK